MVLSAEACAPHRRRGGGLEPRVDDRLRELDFGEAEGRTMAEMERQFPDRVAAFRADPVADHLPGGEHPRAAAQRGVACIRDIALTHRGGHVLVVAHTTLLRLVLCQLLGLPLSEYRRVFLWVRNCGLTEIHLDGDLVSLLEYNVPIEGVG
jgi:broad specificity phosphatase PhoE